MGGLSTKKVALLVQPPHGQGVNIIAFKISSLCTRHLSHADSYTVDKFDLARGCMYARTILRNDIEKKMREREGPFDIDSMNLRPCFTE